MEKRIGVVSIIVEQFDHVSKVNAIIHDYMHIVVGRMGIPYREREISAVISIVVDGTSDEISALTGKLGKLEGIHVKSLMNKR